MNQWGSEHMSIGMHKKGYSRNTQRWNPYTTSIGETNLPLKKGGFTSKEKMVIRRYNTPLRVQKYLHSLKYNDVKPDTAKSFRRVVQTRSAHCLEGAVTAAVILEQYGYPPLILDIVSRSNPDHVVYLYRSKRTALWGSIGKSKDPGLCGRKAVFRTVHGLLYSYFDPFIDHDGKIVGYGVGNLHDLGNYDWRFSKRNLWRLERFFNEIPHKRVRSSKQRYQYWLKRYMEFKVDNPDEKPIFYSNRWKWLPGYLDMR